MCRQPGFSAVAQNLSQILYCLRINSGSYKLPFLLIMYCTFYREKGEGLKVILASQLQPDMLKCRHKCVFQQQEMFTWSTTGSACW